MESCRFVEMGNFLSDKKSEIDIIVKHKSLQLDTDVLIEDIKGIFIPSNIDDNSLVVFIMAVLLNAGDITTNEDYEDSDNLQRWIKLVSSSNKEYVERNNIDSARDNESADYITAEESRIYPTLEENKNSGECSYVVKPTVKPRISEVKTETYIRGIFPKKLTPIINPIHSDVGIDLNMPIASLIADQSQSSHAKKLIIDMFNVPIKHHLESSSDKFTILDQVSKDLKFEDLLEDSSTLNTAAQHIVLSAGYHIGYEAALRDGFAKDNIQNLIKLVNDLTNTVSKQHNTLSSFYQHVKNLEKKVTSPDITLIKSRLDKVEVTQLNLEKILSPTLKKNKEDDSASESDSDEDSNTRYLNKLKKGMVETSDDESDQDKESEAADSDVSNSGSRTSSIVIRSMLKKKQEKRVKPKRKTAEEKPSPIETSRIDKSKYKVIHF